MKIAMINGSPKSKNSASEALLQDLKSCHIKNAVFKDFCFNKPEVDAAIALELNKCDIFVFAFPLYVDGIPSQLLSCLYQIEKIGIDNKNIRVYGISNSGFYEGEQNAIAIEILKNWCNKLGLQWGMGIGVGGGGGLLQMQSAPLGKGPKTSLGDSFCKLKNNIENNENAKDIYISVDFPRWLYKIGAEFGWKQMIKANGGKVSGLKHRY